MEPHGDSVIKEVSRRLRQNKIRNAIRRKNPKPGRNRIRYDEILHTHTSAVYTIPNIF